jgi:2-alkyl-3-oxoalkanoate reductase
MSLKGRSVLVTGATGTVGSAVVQAFVAEGARVRAMARRHDAVPPGSDRVVGDLTNTASLRAAFGDSTLVVNCAAYLGFDSAAALRVNRDGVANVAAACKDAGARLVHISTVSVYDFRGRTFFDEDAPMTTAEKDVYGFTKAEGERALTKSGIEWTILRPVMVLSLHPRSTWGPLAIARAKKSAAPILRFPEMPYVHVENLARAVVLAATSVKAVGRIYNVVDAAGPTRDFLAAVAHANGQPAPELPDGMPRLRFDGERIKSELGWAPVDKWREFLDALAAYEPHAQ